MIVVHFAQALTGQIPNGILRNKNHSYPRPLSHFLSLICVHTSTWRVMSNTFVYYCTRKQNTIEVSLLNIFNGTPE